MAHELHPGPFRGSRFPFVDPAPHGSPHLGPRIQRLRHPVCHDLFWLLNLSRLLAIEADCAFYFSLPQRADRQLRLRPRSVIKPHMELQLNGWLPMRCMPSTLRCFTRAPASKPVPRLSILWHRSALVTAYHILCIQMGTQTLKISRLQTRLLTLFLRRMGPRQHFHGLRTMSFMLHCKLQDRPSTLLVGRTCISTVLATSRALTQAMWVAQAILRLSYLIK